MLSQPSFDPGLSVRAIELGPWAVQALAQLGYPDASGLEGENTDLTFLENLFLCLRVLQPTTEPLWLFVVN